MMISLLVSAALSAQAPAAVQKVEFGHAQWDRLPRVERSGRPLPYLQMVGVAEQVLKDRQCRLEGQSARKFDITIPYAVFLGADGKAQRVLVAEMGCAPLQELVGEVVYQLSDLGDFKTGSPNDSRWYADKINLTLE